MKCKPQNRAENGDYTAELDGFENSEFSQLFSYY